MSGGCTFETRCMVKMYWGAIGDLGYCRAAAPPPAPARGRRASGAAGARGRRRRGRAHDAADLRARRRGARRLARRRLPRRRAARLLGLGLGARASAPRWPARWPSTSSTSRRRAGSRSARARTGSRSSSSSSPRSWPARWPSRRARGPARPTSAAARPTSPPRWRGCCCAAGACEEALPLVAAPPGPGARAAVGRARAALRRGRRRGASPSRCASTRGRSGRCSCPRALSEAVLHRLQRRVVPALEALLAAALERDELLGDAVETARAAPLRRPEDRAAARRLARPALPADRDPRRRRRARLAGAHRGRAPRARRRRRHRGDPALAPRSTTCSTSRGWRRTPPSRGASGRSVERGARGRRRRPRRCPRARSGSRSTPTSRRSAPTPPSSSARSRTCSRTRAATRGGHPVSVRARAVGRRVLVRVVDRGPGIPSRAARPDLRALLPRRAPSAPGTAAPGSGWRSRAASSRPTAARV